MKTHSNPPLGCPRIYLRLRRALYQLTVVSPPTPDKYVSRTSITSACIVPVYSPIPCLRMSLLSPVLTDDVTCKKSVLGGLPHYGYGLDQGVLK